MINLEQEYFSSPYYFFLTEKKNDFHLYFSCEPTLSEARKNDKMINVTKDKVGKVKKYLETLVKSDSKKTTDEVNGELEELVNADGNIMNSKIPILDPTMHPRKTLDQTVAATRQTNDPFFRGRGYRSYFGESEMTEEDMSAAFGYEETKDLDGKETYKYYKDELEMEPDEAKDRTKQQGKDPSGEKDKKSKYYKDKNFITRATISEIQKQKMIKVLEDILTKRKDTSDADVNKKEENKTMDDLPLLVKKHMKSLLKHAESNNISKKDLIKLLKGE